MTENRTRALIGGLLAALLAPACASFADKPTPRGAAGPIPRDADAISLEEAGIDPAAAERADFLARLEEALATPERIATDELVTGLEHLIPSWYSEQRTGGGQALENILTIRVVTHFDAVLGAFERGVHEQRLVAAWALGFSRVPENALGIESPHPRALRALVAVLGRADDDLTRNVLFALWKIGDPSTPLGIVLDFLVEHHDPEVRSNAALALTTILRDETAREAVDGVAVALSDREPKVRLHAAKVARRFPSSQFVPKLTVGVRNVEELPLVRASMVTALAMCGGSSSGRTILPLLRSPVAIEAIAARQALISIYGIDAGPDIERWETLVE